MEVKVGFGIFLPDQTKLIAMKIFFVSWLFFCHVRWVVCDFMFDQLQVCICMLQACPLTSGSWCSVHNGPGHVRGEKVKPMSCDTICWQTARCCPCPTSTLKSKTWHQVLFPNIYVSLFYVICFFKLSRNQTL